MNNVLLSNPVLMYFHLYGAYLLPMISAIPSLACTEVEAVEHRAEASQHRGPA